MTPSDHLARDKATIRVELECLACARRTTIYGDAAQLVERSARGLGCILDAIGRKRSSQNRPDLGALVVRVGAGLPSYIGAGPAERTRAIAVQEVVFAAWVGPRG